MRLSIIIVNYNTSSITMKCIDSIVATTKMEYEIIVVDNNSTDDSKELIPKNYPNIIWVQNEVNEGFGRANNLGVSNAKGDYLLFLNSDVFVSDNSIERCVEHMMSNTDIGVLGCAIHNEDGSLQNSRYYFVAELKGILKNNLVYEKYFYTKPDKVKAIMGAFMLCSKDVFTNTGGFDPDFFMYSEEIEFCNRVLKNGKRIEYYDEVSVKHIHGASSTNKKKSIQQNYLSNSLLFLKARGYWGYFIFHFGFGLNTVTNFFGMWLLTKEYRLDYWKIQGYYFSNFIEYIKLPFLFKPSMGDGKRLLQKK